MILHPEFPPEVYLEGAITRLSTLSRDYQGPRAVLNALERLATGYGSECVRVRQDLAIAESQLRDYRERLGKPFAHEQYLSELTALRDQLKLALSGGNTESDDETGPDSFGVADKIKSLKAANTIETTTPQRVQSKQATAEEPITARIRKRQEANSASDHLVEGDVSPEPSALQPPPAAGDDSSDGQPMTFQERIAMERKRQDHEPSLP
jgi:hypothetical protein